MELNYNFNCGKKWEILHITEIFMTTLLVMSHGARDGFNMETTLVV